FALVAEIDQQRGIIKIKTLTAVPRVVDWPKRKDGQEVPGRTVEIATLALASTMAMSAIRVLDADGKEVEGPERWNRLAIGKLVLCTQGSPPDPVFLKLLARETVILVNKSPEPPLIDVREAEEKVRKVIARYPGPRYKREQKTAEKPIIQVELW